MSANRGMIRVDLHRAQDAVTSEPVSIATIQIHEPIPESGAIDEGLRAYESKSRATFDEEAAKLARALIATLPGGTIDALLVQLLDHKRSLFRVAHDRLDHEGMSDSTYAALGQMVQTLTLELVNGKLSNMASHIMKAIDALSPIVGAEVRTYGPADTYAKRW